MDFDKTEAIRFLFLLPCKLLIHSFDLFCKGTFDKLLLNFNFNSFSLNFGLDPCRYKKPSGRSTQNNKIGS